MDGAMSDSFGGGSLRPVGYAAVAFVRCRPVFGPLRTTAAVAQGDVAHLQGTVLRVGNDLRLVREFLDSELGSRMFVVEDGEGAQQNQVGHGSDGDSRELDVKSTMCGVHSAKTSGGDERDACAKCSGETGAHVQIGRAHV